MAIRVQRHTSVSKQAALLAGVDCSAKWRDLDHMTGKCFSPGIEKHRE